MRGKAIEDGKRWLEQVREDLKWAKDLADSIPARVYTRDAANDAVRLADDILEFVDGKIRAV